MDFLSNMMEKICLLKMKGTKPLVINLDKICNQDCLFCFQWNHKQNFHPTLSTILEKIGDVDRVDLFGGEPTVYKNFFELLDFLYERQIRISLATNMIKFSEKDFFDRFKKYENISIRGSILGIKETHDHYTRTVGSFDKMISGLKNLVSTYKDIRMNTVILPKNLKELEEIVDLIYEIGIRKFKFSMPVSVPYDIEEDVFLNIKEIKPILDPVLNKLKELQCDFQIEKSPFCLSQDNVKNFLLESSQNFGKDCNTCYMRNNCFGVCSEYLDKFKDDGFIEMLP